MAMHLLDQFLTCLDCNGAAYTVSIDHGPHHGVMQHSPDCIQVCRAREGGNENSPQFTQEFYNLANVRCVEVELLP